MPYARMCDAQIEKHSEDWEWATHLSPAPLVIFLLFPQCSQNPFRAAAFEFSPRDSPQNTERFAVYMISEHPISHKSESVGEKKTTIRWAPGEIEQRIKPAKERDSSKKSELDRVYLTIYNDYCM